MLKLMDTQQPQQPTNTPPPAEPPPVSPPSSIPTSQASQGETLQGESNIKDPVSSVQLPSSKISRLAPLLLIPLIITTFATSFFFFSHQRQPKSQSRASAPTPSPRRSPAEGGTEAGLLPISPSLTADNQPLISSTPSSTIPASPAGGYNLPSLIPTSSSGFGTLINSPTPLPPPPENLPPATFNIVAANDTFTPNQLTAQRGQIVTIYISASDKTYDVSIPALGLSRIISKGDRKSLEFQASTFGQYVFACASYCNTATARGILTIKP